MNIDDLVQHYSNSIANTLGLLQSCTNHRYMDTMMGINITVEIYDILSTARIRWAQQKISYLMFGLCAQLYEWQQFVGNLLTL